MRSILVLGLMATLTVAAVESLKCSQCVSFPPFSDTCPGDDDDKCPEGYVSCGCSKAHWVVGGEHKHYHEKFCSTLPAGTSLAFGVRVSEDEEEPPAWFETKTVEEGELCGFAPPEDLSGLPLAVTDDTECPACIDDTDSCEGTPLTCAEDEQCVDLTAEFDIHDSVVRKEDAQYKLAIQGPSNIPPEGCAFLEPGNVKVGHVTFPRFKCSPPTISANP